MVLMPALGPGGELPILERPLAARALQVAGVASAAEREGLAWNLNLFGQIL